LASPPLALIFDKNKLGENDIKICPLSLQKLCSCLLS
jgi:hypothetical protein